MKVAIIASETCHLTLPELATAIDAAHAKVEAAARSGLAHAREAGERLIEAKRRIGHGGWLAWLAANCKVSERTAQRYMQVAEHWHELGKSDNVTDLTMRDGLKMLAKPKEPTPANAAYPMPALTWGKGYCISGHDRHDNDKVVVLIDPHPLSDSMPAGEWWVYSIYHMAGYVDHCGRGISRDGLLRYVLPRVMERLDLDEDDTWLEGEPNQHPEAWQVRVEQIERSTLQEVRLGSRDGRHAPTEILRSIVRYEMADDAARDDLANEYAATWPQVPSRVFHALLDGQLKYEAEGDEVVFYVDPSVLEAEGEVGE